MGRCHVEATAKVGNLVAGARRKERSSVIGWPYLETGWKARMEVEEKTDG